MAANALSGEIQKKILQLKYDMIIRRQNRELARQKLLEVNPALAGFDALGVPSKVIADLMGVDPSQVSLWRSGRVPVTGWRQVVLYNLLHIFINDFAGAIVDGSFRWLGDDHSDDVNTTDNERLHYARACLDLQYDIVSRVPAQDKKLAEKFLEGNLG